MVGWLCNNFTCSKILLTSALYNRKKKQNENEPRDKSKLDDENYIITAYKIAKRDVQFYPIAAAEVETRVQPTRI